MVSTAPTQAIGKRQRSTSETSDDDFKRVCPTNEVYSNAGLTSCIAPSSLGTTTYDCYGCSAVREQEGVPNSTADGDGRTSEEVAPTENIEAYTMDSVNPPGIETIPDTRAGTSMEPVSAAEVRTLEADFVTEHDTVIKLSARLEKFLRLGKDSAYWAQIEGLVPLFLEGRLEWAMKEELQLRSDIKNCEFAYGENKELRLALQAKKTEWWDIMSEGSKGYSALYKRHYSYKSDWKDKIPESWKSGPTIEKLPFTMFPDASDVFSLTEADL